MEVVSSRRLTSPEWVTTGVGPNSRVASVEADLLGRVLQPGAPVGTVSWFSRTFLPLRNRLKAASYLYGDFFCVKFQPSIQRVEPTEQLKSTRSVKNSTVPRLTRKITNNAITIDNSKTKHKTENKRGVQKIKLKTECIASQTQRNRYITKTHKTTSYVDVYHLLLCVLKVLL